MLKINNLYLNIREKQILSDVNMALQNGKIYGLTGDNGSGKTMLMKCICGFVKPSSGNVIVDDKEVGVDMDYLNNAGIIIETPGFIPYYSGMKNLKMLAGINGKTSVSQIKNAISLCGLDPELKVPVKKYSLGMRQRLGIAQAIMEDNEILILDEPMNGLDKNGVVLIRELLLNLKRKGKLIILASHNKEDIDVLCDEVYYVDCGNIKKCNKSQADEEKN